MTEIGTARIESFAAKTWAQLCQQFASGVAFWQDLDGGHLDRLPESCPWTSFLWADSGDGTVLARVRLDPGAEYPVVAGALLRIGGTSGEASEPEYVRVRCRDAVPGWGTDEKRVSKDAGELSDGIWTVYETVEPSPLTFVRLAGRG